MLHHAIIATLLENDDTSLLALQQNMPIPFAIASFEIFSKCSVPFEK
jgi:hypothetical protein